MRIWICFILASSCAWSLPSGLEIEAGVCSAENSGLDLRVQCRDEKSILQWDSFSIEPSESVYFDLPSQNSCVLNRVVGGQMSEIHGKLSSNGVVWLCNSAGIYVGENGTIDSNSFIGCGFDILSADFINNRWIGSGDVAGDLKIHGYLTSPNGSILLAGKNIEFKGTVEGEFIQAAAKGIIYFQSASEPELLIETSLESETPYQHAIRWEGNTKVSGEGMIQLATSGQLEVAGSIEGDKIGADFFGSTVWIESSASLSCPESKIRAGGSSYGLDLSVPHADWGWVQPGAVIDISGKDGNDAGSFLIWGTKGVSYEGFVIGRSGPDGGRGGIVEVSTHGQFCSNGPADLKGVDGNGTVIWDPIDVTISTAASTVGVIVGNPTTFPASSTANVNTTDLQNQLGAGNNVLINATNSGSGGSGTITWVSTFNPLGTIPAGSLTLTGTTVTINPGVTVSIQGFNSGLTINATTFTMGAGSAFDFFNGSLIITTTGNTSIQSTISSSGSVFFYGPVVLLGPTTINAQGLNTFVSVNGAFDLTINGGAANLYHNLGTTTPLASFTFSGLALNTEQITATGNISISSSSVSGNYTSNGGDISINGAIQIGGDLGFNALSGAISISNTIDSISLAHQYSLSLSNGSGGITIAGNIGSSFPLTSFSSTNSGSFSANGIAVNNDISITCSTLTLGGNLSGSGTLTLQPFTDSSSIGIGTGASGVFSISDAELALIQSGFSSVVIGSQTGSGAINVNSTTYQNGTLIQSPTGSISINGAITVNGSGNGFQMSAATIALTDDITTDGVSIVFTGPVTVSGSPSLSTGAGSGGITFSSTLNGAAALTLAANTGAVLHSGRVGNTTPLSSYTVSDSGSFTSTAALIATGAISITSSNLRIAGSFGTVNSDLSFLGPVILLGSTAMTTGSGIGDILFSSTLTGAQTLLMTAGTGAVTFTGEVGATPLLSLGLLSSSTCTVMSNITAVGAIDLISKDAVITGLLQSLGQ